jgi:hypothetical protein
MSVSVWCEIVCGDCSIPSEGVFSDDYLPKGRLLEYVRAAGWIVEKDEVFCSVGCRDRYRERNANEPYP